VSFTVGPSIRLIDKQSDLEFDIHEAVRNHAVKFALWHGSSGV
jgi:hypothetical protein